MVAHIRFYLIFFIILTSVFSSVVYGASCTSTPTDGCTVDGDLTFTAGTYNLPATEGSAIVINCNDCYLDCGVEQ